MIKINRSEFSKLLNVSRIMKCYSNNYICYLFVCVVCVSLRKHFVVVQISNVVKNYKPLILESHFHFFWNLFSQKSKNMFWTDKRSFKSEQNSRIITQNLFCCNARWSLSWIFFFFVTDFEKIPSAFSMTSIIVSNK